MTQTNGNALVGVIMGSISDGDIADKAIDVLKEFGVPYEVGVKSAHRTPQRMLEYARDAAGRGLQVIIAIAGGSAHLPGMVASETLLPVLAVPVRRSQKGHGDEARKSSIAMPPGIPLPVFGDNAADRAALFAVRVLSLNNPELAAQYSKSQQDMAANVASQDELIQSQGWDKAYQDWKDS